MSPDKNIWTALTRHKLNLKLLYVAPLLATDTAITAHKKRNDYIIALQSYDSQDCKIVF